MGAHGDESRIYEHLVLLTSFSTSYSIITFIDDNLRIYSPTILPIEDLFPVLMDQQLCYKALLFNDLTIQIVVLLVLTIASTSKHSAKNDRRV